MHIVCVPNRQGARVMESVAHVVASRRCLSLSVDGSVGLARKSHRATYNQEKKQRS